MYNLTQHPKTTLGISKFNRRAVSPVVATLVLIVIAIVGAVGVGLILSGVSTGVNKQVGQQGNGESAQNTILLGGSTTLFPLDEAAIPAFEAQTHLKVVDAQGGSDAGMQGIISGALDIGAASSANAVNNAENDVVNNNLVGITINAVLIGGSGVVVGTTSVGVNATGVPYKTFTSTSGTAIGAAPLFDTANDACLLISRAALAQMYIDGQFFIAGKACGATSHHSLAAANVTTTAGGNAGPFQTISRLDPGGTEDAFGAYIKGQGTPALSYTSGSGVLGASSNTGTGNLGVLTATQGCTFSGVKGCVGFFDLGFAEGASPAAAATCSGTGSVPCKVFIPELSTPDGASADALQSATSSAVNQYIFPTQTTAGLHALIKSALSKATNTNPLTLQPTPASVYPDSTAPANTLARLFYYVTNGTPTPIEQQWINFMTSPNAETFYTAQGYFTQFDITQA